MEPLRGSLTLGVEPHRNFLRVVTFMPRPAGERSPIGRWDRMPKGSELKGSFGISLVLSAQHLLGGQGRWRHSFPGSASLLGDAQSHLCVPHHRARSMSQSSPISTSLKNLHL